MSEASVATVRTSRKHHRCDGCTRPILPGERYARHLAFPGHTYAADWGVYRECAACAARYGRPIEVSA